ncbi:hypothetical protein SS50377_25203 [Spironucleus salmonicida]|uniref:Uncharacterized protein n=1 Tax=Spironucleus salmonicida TaxID=348837 RepID=V6LQK2_9EUKA|nr:hypothetical protein SS50377_25203 [Spironucleus salmonicida]|eukprot:EST46860.1 Hypothetical protein SS50377_13124 [Spironucleus salmonicida]
MHQLEGTLYTQIVWIQIYAFRLPGQVAPEIRFSHLQRRRLTPLELLLLVPTGERCSNMNKIAVRYQQPVNDIKSSSHATYLAGNDAAYVPSSDMQQTKSSGIRQRRLQPRSYSNEFLPQIFKLIALQHFEYSQTARFRAVPAPTETHYPWTSVTPSELIERRDFRLLRSQIPCQFTVLASQSSPKGANLVAERYLKSYLRLKKAMN